MSWWQHPERWGTYPGDVAGAERDGALARWCGMDADEEAAFVARLARFDFNTRAYEARVAAQEERQALAEALDYAERRQAILKRVARWDDSRAGILVRVDAVIADLVEQLADAPCGAAA